MALQHWLDPILNPKACLDLIEPPMPRPETPEALLSRLERQLRQHIKHATPGQKQSLLRGQGLEFNQLRPYIPGDDIRKIDWNVFARTLTPYIKEYQEEKQLTLWLAVDLTPSMQFGKQQPKALKAIELAGMLGLLAQWGNHRLGLFCFNGQEKIILPPSSANSQLHRVLQCLQDQHQATCGQPLEVAPQFFQQMCQALQHVVPRQATLFFLSDFMNPGAPETWDYALGELSRHCGILYFLLEDPSERQLPQGVGMFPCVDPETHQVAWLDTHHPKQRAAYEKAYQASKEALCQRLSKTGRVLPVLTTEDLLYPLLHACQGAWKHHG